MPFDPRIAKEAGAFYEAGSRCYKEICQIKLNRDNVYKILPCVMNLTFSVELFLKACIGKKIKNHKLAELFNLVPKGEKKAIIQMTIAKYTSNEEQFWKKLKEIEDAFVEWRYFYEQKHNLNLDILFLLALVDTLNFKLGTKVR